MKGITRASFVIGLALSGFFDGILLHQVLQWHHFLSLVPGAAFRDLRVQVYADGLFHVAVYLIALLGLFGLWRSRSQLRGLDATRHLLGGSLLGFGVWNIVDVGFFHWILGIHRIRVNVPSPMAYDVAWILVFGVAVAALGWWVLNRQRPQGGPRGRTAGATLALLLVAAAPVANIPQQGGSTLVVFRPDIGPAAAVNAIVAAGGAILMIDPEGGFAVVSLDPEVSRLPLYRAGALLVTRSPVLAGCLAFARGKAA